MTTPNRPTRPEHVPSARTTSDNGSEPPLEVGQYVTYRSRNKQRYAMVDVIGADGRPWISGCLAEDIPDGTIVQPVKDVGDGFVAAKRKARPHKRPEPFDSRIPCANRQGQPVVVRPQCDGSKNADSLLRTAPAFSRTTKEQKGALEEAGCAMGRGDFAGFLAAMGRGMDIRDYPLCRDCSGAFFLGRGQRGDLLDGRTGGLHSLRPDV